MAYLKVDKGDCPGQMVELRGERMVLGRHPNCEIVLDNIAVSRRHAQILESHGTYYLEDLRSRNRTYLNGAPVDGRMELHDRDTIKVCDVTFSFYRHLPPLDDESGTQGGLERPPTQAVTQVPQIPGSGGSGHVVIRAPLINLEGGADESSSIVTKLSASRPSSLLLKVNAETKLKAVLDIARSLRTVLKVDDVLQKLLESLFAVFPQADRGFVLLTQPGTDRLSVKASKSRQGKVDEPVRISMTVVRQALESGDAILTMNALDDSRFNTSDSMAELQLRSMMCVPLLETNDQPLGVIQLDAGAIGRPFDQDDLDMLVSVATQASLAVENARLHEELVQQRDMDRDIEFATQIQLGFLPNKRPSVPGFRFYDYYEAALGIGGDYFDYVALSDSKLAVALGDVAGKGVPAALLMARLYSSARYHLLTNGSAAKALTGLNTEIASSGLGFRFITCIFAVIDSKENTVTIANAGHMAPLLRKRDGSVTPYGLKESGMPLGVKPQLEYGQTTMQFDPGDALVFYTDGITESMNPKNDIYGRRRLTRLISKGPVHVEDLTRAIVADVEKFARGRAQRDDMCLVCFERVDESAAAREPAVDVAELDLSGDSGAFPLTSAPIRA